MVQWGRADHAMVNVRACDVCPASANERDFLPRACVHEHGAHERFLYDRENGECPCGRVYAYEPLLDASAGVNALRCL